MSFRLYRRSVALVTAMLFAISMAGHGFVVANMDMKAMAAVPTMEMSSADSSTSMDCDENDLAMQFICHAFCAGTVAVLSQSVYLPTTITLHPTDSFYVQASQSRHSPPDTHPPQYAA